MKHEIIIAGRIERDMVEKINEKLKNIAESDTVTVKIDSNGGDTVAGLALHDLLDSHKCRKEAVVLGMCASAATLPAIACHSITMMPNATWMVHAPAGGLFGTVAQIESQLVHFRNLEQQVVTLYSKHTGRSEEEIRAELSRSSFYRASEALSHNWVTSVLGGESSSEAPSPEPQPKALTAGYEREFKLWASIPEMIAAGVDLFRSPEDKEQRKATEQLAALQSELEKLRSECAAASASADAVRKELTAMAAEKEEYAKSYAAAALAALGRDTAPLPESRSDIPSAPSIREQITRAAEQGGIESAFAAARAAAGFRS